jgi:hypothetical protein
MVLYIVTLYNKCTRALTSYNNYTRALTRTNIKSEESNTGHVRTYPTGGGQGGVNCVPWRPSIRYAQTHTLSHTQKHASTQRARTHTSARARARTTHTQRAHMRTQTDRQKRTHEFRVCVHDCPLHRRQASRDLCDMTKNLKEIRGKICCWGSCRSWPSTAASLTIKLKEKKRNPVVGVQAAVGHRQQTP